MVVCILSGSICTMPGFAAESIPFADFDEPTTIEVKKGVNVELDDKSFVMDMLHVNEEPCMSISDIATLTGGLATDDSITLKDETYTFEGETVDCTLTYDAETKVATVKVGDVVLSKTLAGDYRASNVAAAYGFRLKGPSSGVTTLSISDVSLKMEKPTVDSTEYETVTQNNNVASSASGELQVIQWNPSNSPSHTMSSSSGKFTLTAEGSSKNRGIILGLPKNSSIKNNIDMTKVVYTTSFKLHRGERGGNFTVEVLGYHNDSVEATGIVFQNDEKNGKFWLNSPQGSETVAWNEGSRLAKDSKGHLMLEAPATVYNGEMYIPVTFLQITMYYDLHYNRFANLLKMTSGNQYPKIEQVIRVKDYGAVGDGITDDRGAILRAFDDAMTSDVPVRLEFEENKVYLVSERIDHFGFFVMYDRDNMEINGQGSTLLLKTPTNTVLEMDNCHNITFKNLNVKYKEHPSTQGRIVAVDSENGTFDWDIDEGMELPAYNEWIYHHNTDGTYNGWWRGFVYDADEHRKHDGSGFNFDIGGIEHVKDRVYRVALEQNSVSKLPLLKVGERFVINNYGHKAYNLSSQADGKFYKQGDTTTMRIIESGDITFENFWLHGGPFVLYGITLATGKITFRNSGSKTSDGRLIVNGSDGIHTTLCRGPIIMENCTFEDNMDDLMNLKAQGCMVKTNTDERTYRLEKTIHAKQGDKLIFFDATKRKILGTAYVEVAESTSAGAPGTVTLDREIEGIVCTEGKSTEGTFVWNANACNQGSVIKNTIFKNSSRWILISAANTLFEGNTVKDCIGVAFKDERTGTTWSAVPPSSSTIRNNSIIGTRSATMYASVELMLQDAKLGSSAGIDGLLFEGNIIDQPNDIGSIDIMGVKNLYMMNNVIKNNVQTEKTMIPVKIYNSEVEVLDGLSIEYTAPIEAGITITGSKIDEENIKNIEIISPEGATSYIINLY